MLPAGRCRGHACRVRKKDPFSAIDTRPRDFIQLAPTHVVVGIFLKMLSKAKKARAGRRVPGLKSRTGGSDEFVDEVFEEFLAAADVGRRFALLEHVSFQLGRSGLAGFDPGANA